MKSDFKIEIMDKSPIGGQKSGRMPIGVKVTHVPTGLTASCDNARSQYLNREIAMQMVLKGLEFL